MKAIARSLVVVLVALIAVPALVVSVTITATVQLLATTALIMGGTQHPLSPDVDSDSFVATYFDQAVNHYIVPGSHPPPPVTPYAVTYPAEFAPVFGTTTFDSSVEQGVANLGSCLGAADGDCAVRGGSQPPPASETHFVVFGYSQSAVVASLVKNQLIDGEIDDENLDGTEFYLISNPMRPNGGILGRGFEGMTIPLIGITFYGPTKNSCPTATPCSPTASATDPNIYPTVDVAQQYDFLGGDAPARPLNILAMANSLAAYAQLHGDVPTHQIGEDGMINQGKYGDTQYYLIASQRLPILMPLGTIGVPDPILAVVDAPLRVLIEDAYVRDASPGEHVQFQLLPVGDPIKLLTNLAESIPVGIDDGLQEAGVGRALGTQDVYRPFGVGGPVYSKDSANEWEEVPAQSWNPVNIAPRSAGPTASPAAAVGPSPATARHLAGDSNQTKSGDADAIVNDTKSDDTTVPPGTRPDPFGVRGAFGADRPKPFAGLRPDGDGPIKQVFKKLTGQQHKDGDTKTSDDPKAKDAAA
jgi:PE-PPE domain